MKRALIIVGIVLGLVVGGGAGSYWYVAPTDTASEDQAKDEPHTFIDLEPKFVVPLVRDNRVRALIVAALRLEVRSGTETSASALKPKIRDVFLDTLYAMAVAGSFGGDLYSNNVQGEMRARLLEAAKQVLGGDVRAVLIAELLRQDQ